MLVSAFVISRAAHRKVGRRCCSYDLCGTDFPGRFDGASLMMDGWGGEKIDVRRRLPLAPNVNKPRGRKEEEDLETQLERKSSKLRQSSCSCSVTLYVVVRNHVHILLLRFETMCKCASFYGFSIPSRLPPEHTSYCIPTCLRIGPMCGMCTRCPPPLPRSPPPRAFVFPSPLRSRYIVRPQ